MVCQNSMQSSLIRPITPVRLSLQNSLGLLRRATVSAIRSEDRLPAVSGGAERPTLCGPQPCLASIASFMPPETQGSEGAGAVQPQPPLVDETGIDRARRIYYARPRALLINYPFSGPECQTSSESTSAGVLVFGATYLERASVVPLSLGRKALEII
jgi:hypothetical protein